MSHIYIYSLSLISVILISNINTFTLHLQAPTKNVGSHSADRHQPTVMSIHELSLPNVRWAVLPIVCHNTRLFLVRCLLTYAPHAVGNTSPLVPGVAWQKLLSAIRVQSIVLSNAEPYGKVHLGRKLRRGGGIPELPLHIHCKAEIYTQ